MARGARNHLPHKFGDATMANREVLSEENESRLQHRCAFILIGFNGTLRRIKLSKKRRRGCRSSNRQIRDQTLFIQIVPWNFVRAREDLCWNHDKSNPHRSETNGIAENAVRRVKDGISALLVQSGLSESGGDKGCNVFRHLPDTQDKLAVKTVAPAQEDVALHLRVKG